MPRSGLTEFSATHHPLDTHRCPHYLILLTHSAEFGLFEIDQFTFGLLYFLGLKFISKRILGHNILQLKYIFSFFFNDSPSPATYCGVVEWQANVRGANSVRGGNPAQYAVVSQLIRSDGSYKSYYINKSLYDMIRMSKNNDMYDLIYRA